MIEATTGNLLRARADALVNTVNCVGVMGKGIALQFKQAWPAMFDAYARAAKAGEIMPGRMFLYETGKLVGPRYIINFPRKRHWKGRSLIEDIDAGLVDLVAIIRARSIRSIAIPPLGAGNGGLDWSVVRPRIVAALAGVPDVQVLLFDPQGEPAPSERVIGTERPPLTTARALFLQLAGEPLRLKFERAPGPYAHNLNQVLRLAPGAVAEAVAFLRTEAGTSARLARVARLIEGFETPYGLELLATVPWVAEEAQPPVEDGECVRRIHEWNERKATVLRADHIGVALGRLREEGFLAGEPLSG